VSFVLVGFVDATVGTFCGEDGALSEEATNVIDARSTTTEPNTVHAHHTR
jgi:hypothetical protein